MGNTHCYPSKKANYKNLIVLFKILVAKTINQKGSQLRWRMFCSFFVFAGGVCGADKAIPMNLEITEEVERETNSEAFYLFLFCFVLVFFLELLKKKIASVGMA